MNVKKRTVNLLGGAFIIGISFLCIVPVLVILSNSLKTSIDATTMSLSMPDFPFQWVNFLTVIEKGNLIVSFMNSMLYSIGAVLLCVGVSSFASYVLARNTNKINNMLYYFIVLGMTMPINFVALIKVMQVLHLMNSRAGMILLYCAMQIPFSVFIIYGFINSIPTELDEAGIIDGCAPLPLFLRIIVPLLKPVLATAIVLTFLNTWNEFILPLYFLNSSSKWPMTLAVYKFFGMFSKDWNLVSADMVLTILPVVIIYILGQKYIISGMTMGSVKG